MAESEKIILTPENREKIRDYLSRGGFQVLFNEEDQEIYKRGGNGDLRRTLTYSEALEIISGVYSTSQ